MSVERMARADLGHALPDSRINANSAIALAVVTLGALLLAPSTRSLAAEWVNTEHLTYLHGYLIAALCVWLLIRACAPIAEPPRPDWRFALAIVPAVFCWLIFLRAGIQTLHQVLFPVLLFLAVIAAIGWRNARRAWFPFAFFYFAVPVWGAGNEMLQSISTHAVKAMLALSSVPAFVDGNFVHIPAGIFEIAGGCSGMHFFIVALALATLVGEVHRDSLRTRVLTMVVAVFIAMACNWIRIYTIVVAGHLTDMQHYLVRVDHYYFGWGVFALGMLGFFWFANRLPLREQLVAAPHTIVAAMPRARLALGIALSLGTLAIGPVIGAFAAAPVTAHPGAQLLREMPGWAGPIAASSPWRPHYPASDSSMLGEYRRDAVRLTAFVAEYQEQRQGKEVVAYDNSLLDGIEASVESRRTVALVDGRAQELRLSGLRGPALLTYYYSIGTRRTPSDLGAQLTYGLTSIAQPVDSNIVAVHVDCAASCEAAALATRQWFEDFERTRGIR